MPVEFTYHEPSDEVAYDIPNGTRISEQEAQVVATLQVARAVSDIRGVLKDMLHLAEKELDRLDPPG